MSMTQKSNRDQFRDFSGTDFVARLFRYQICSKTFPVPKLFQDFSGTKFVPRLFQYQICSKTFPVPTLFQEFSGTNFLGTDSKTFPVPFSESDSETRRRKKSTTFFRYLLFGKVYFLNIFAQTGGENLPTIKSKINKSSETGDTIWVKGCFIVKHFGWCIHNLE